MKDFLFSEKTCYAKDVLGSDDKNPQTFSEKNLKWESIPKVDT